MYKAPPMFITSLGNMKLDKESCYACFSFLYFMVLFIKHLRGDGIAVALSVDVLSLLLVILGMSLLKENSLATKRLLNRFDETDEGFDNRFDDINNRFDDVNNRFDDATVDRNGMKELCNDTNNLVRLFVSTVATGQNGDDTHESYIKTKMSEVTLNIWDTGCLREIYDIMFYAYLYNKKELVVDCMEKRWVEVCRDRNYPGLKYYVGKYAERFGKGWYQEAYGV